MKSHSSPNPPGADTRAIAAQRLADRRRHIRTIRRRVAGVSAGTFLAVSGGILLQMVTGNDPALARDAHRAKTAAASAVTTTPATTTTAAATTPATTSATATSSARSATTAATTTTTPAATSAAATTSPSAVTTHAS